MGRHPALSFLLHKVQERVFSLRDDLAKPLASSDWFWCLRTPRLAHRGPAKLSLPPASQRDPSLGPKTCLFSFLTYFVWTMPSKPQIPLTDNKNPNSRPGPFQIARSDMEK